MKVLTQKFQIIVIFIFIFFSLSFFVNAYNFDNGDARAVSFGGTSILLDNVNSLWLNPATIYNLKGKEINFSYESLYTGLNPKVYTGESDYFKNLRFSFGMPIKNYIIGVGLFQFYSVFFKNTKLCITFADRIWKSIKFGLNLKYISYKYEKNEYTEINPYLQGVNLEASAIGINFGIVFSIINRHIFTSLVVLNVNQPDIGIVTKDRLNFQARPGIGIKYSNFSLATEIEFSNKKLSKFLLGSEFYFISKNFPIRIGFDNSFAPAIGFTLHIKKNPEIGIDYTAKIFTELENNSGSHYFTIFMKF